jgi:hypothetical protein
MGAAGAPEATIRHVLKPGLGASRARPAGRAKRRARGWRILPPARTAAPRQLLQSDCWRAWCTLGRTWCAHCWMEWRTRGTAACFSDRQAQQAGLGRPGTASSSGKAWRSKQPRTVTPSCSVRPHPSKAGLGRPAGFPGRVPRQGSQAGQAGRPSGPGNVQRCGAQARAAGQAQGRRRAGHSRQDQAHPLKDGGLAQQAGREAAPSGWARRHRPAKHP